MIPYTGRRLATSYLRQLVRKSRLLNSPIFEDPPAGVRSGSFSYDQRVPIPLSVPSRSIGPIRTAVGVQSTEEEAQIDIRLRWSQVHRWK